MSKNSERERDTLPRTASRCQAWAIVIDDPLIVWDRMIAAQDAAWDKLQAINHNFDTQVYDYLCLVAQHRADDSTTCTRKSYKWLTVYETVLPQLIDKLIDQVGTDAIRRWHNPVHPHGADYWNNINNLIGSVNGR